MDIKSFFFPVTSNRTNNISSDALSEYIDVYHETFPNWEDADIILWGCPNRDDSTLFASVDRIRYHLYGFSRPASIVKMVDLGNIDPQNSQDALIEEIADIMGFLLDQGKQVIMMGGLQDLTFGQFLAYERTGKSIEYVHIDSCLDVEDSHDVINRKTVNHRIFTYQPSCLFDFNNLGYQRYFVNPDEIEFLKEHNYSCLRYGQLQEDITLAEPYLRTADMVSIDMSAIRNQDMPGAHLLSPGGFTAMEACRLSRYMGLGYHMSSIHFAEYYSETDPDGLGAMLMAMMIWYVVDGYYSKWNDQPREDRANLRKYSVQLRTSIDSINFYCHMQSGRWWMEVPFPADIGQKYPRNRLVACSASDYEMAKSDEIPDRWWLTFNKLK